MVKRDCGVLNSSLQANFHERTVSGDLSQVSKQQSVKQRVAFKRRSEKVILPVSGSYDLSSSLESDKLWS